MELDKPTFKLSSIDVGQATRLVPMRVDVQELLDLGEGSPQDVQASLADLTRINRYLGGINSVTQHLYPRLLALGRPATVLDIGTGSAEIPRVIARWAHRQGLDIHVAGLDLSNRHLVLAKHSTQNSSRINLVLADANHLPFNANSIDYVISSLFLHHFPPEQSVKLLRQCYTQARRGIIMSDLVRGWLPLLAFKLGQPIFARSYITRYDGAVSVRRAYTPAELESLARAAGIPHPHVYRSWAWRMTLVADK